MTAPILAASRRTRRTPFSTRVDAAGVKGFTVYNHMLLATSFRSVEEDYWHLKRNVQVWDVGCERQVEIAGPDASRLVQWMTPRDLRKAEIGQCLYAPLIDERALMVNDPVILKLAEDRYWLSIADTDVELWAKGLAYAGGMRAEVSEPDVWPLAVQGPKADDLMARVFGDRVRHIRYFRFATLAFKKHPLVVARSGWSRQGGFEIYVDEWALGEKLWDALMDAGEDLDVGPGCPNLIERIESGLLSFGNDLTRESNPLEAGLERYCSPDPKLACMGQKALLQIAAKGVARKVRGIRFEARAVPGCVMPWPVKAKRRRIGEVTSAAVSPQLGCGIAFAMLDRACWDAGIACSVETPDGPRPGIVCDLPFVKPAR
jgi:dimethylsulfoniopropionate demethylase